ncbi:hypothetical protein GYMLUDRAFT_1007158 [Collybiopsis luxurians FD-317 M1]|uniref:Uncharacterized protein n=1 Tax=Collybiopsis luxurians FD-317 M1 TaxID=944289 RepID=A0A0D0C6G9_9AGAR|nr:hypothetical protein GYMLUDRAFT_1007158 [Collybiopsis luxurians FD-317 M1]
MGGDNMDAEVPFGTADGCPPQLTTTKTLEIGWGFITGCDRDSIFEGVEPMQANAWLHISQNQNPILATVADSRSLEAPQHIAVICTLILGTLNIDSCTFEVSLATPALSANGTPSMKAIMISALVLGIPQNLLSYHLGDSGQTTFSSGGQAIHLSRFPPPVDHFLGVVYDLTFDDNELDYSDCVEFLHAAIYDCKPVQPHVVASITEMIM